MQAVPEVATASRAEIGDTILSVRDLHTTFRAGTSRPVPAVDGVSFDLRAGEVLGIVGESGSGKSATAVSLMRLLRPQWRAASSGQIILNGRDLMPLSEKQMGKVRGNEIAMVFQDPMTAFNPALTIGRQIGEVLELHRGMSRSESMARAVELLDLVGIPEAADRVKRHPHEFSGGMRQRAMIAMALACEPSVLIADEPTTGLDVTIQAQILELLDGLRRDLGMGVIMITHDLGVIARVADSVCVMYAGRIVERSDAFTIFGDPEHPYTDGLLTSMPRLGGDRHADLTPIPGSPPDLGALPPGCPFEPRCAHSLGEKCRSEQPLLLQIGSRPDGVPHSKACFLPDGWRAGA